MNRILKIIITFVVIFFGIFSNQTAYAGVYTDDLTKCIVESTTTEDRVQFVKWLYFAISKHPIVKSISSVDESQFDASNKKIANLIMKLMTESCKEKAAKALKYEGIASIEQSFQVFGQIAGQEIFTNPDVAATMSSFEKYLDSNKLKEALEKK